MTHTIRRAFLPMLAALGCGAALLAAAAPAAAAAPPVPISSAPCMSVTGGLCGAPTPAPTNFVSPPCRSVHGGLCGGLHGTVVITDKDGGQSYTVEKGTIIRVELSGNDGVWSEPQSSASSVVHRNSGQRDRDGGASGTFRAKSDGSADIDATAAPHCTKICPMIMRVWSVDITVVS